MSKDMERGSSAVRPVSLCDLSDSLKVVMSLIDAAYLACNGLSVPYETEAMTTLLSHIQDETSDVDLQLSFICAAHPEL